MRRYHQQLRGAGELGQWGKACYRVIRQLVIERRANGVLVKGQQQGVAIGWRVRGDLPRDYTGGAGAVVHDDLLFEHVGQAGAENARQNIEGAALRGGGDQANGTVGVVLLRQCGDREKKLSHGLGSCLAFAAGIY